MRQLVRQPSSKRAADAHVVELRIPSSAEWVGVARLAIAGIASRMEFSIEDIEDLKLAVAEACTSYIQNAQEADELCISAEVGTERITITMDACDASRGAVAASDAPAHGLGSFLIRTLMDEVAYEYAPESGTKLVMTKLLHK